MPRKKNDDLNFRSDIAKYLLTFAEILVRENVLQDTSSINNAAYECRNYPYPGKWGYSIENLTFRRFGAFKTFQSGFDLQNAVLQFSVIVEGLCQETGDRDPLTSLAFRISIEGQYEGTDDV